MGDGAPATRRSPHIYEIGPVRATAHGYTCDTMPDEVVDRVEPSETQSRQESSARDAETGRARRAKKPRRSWKRWLADLMIIAGVLLLAYPLGTWGYTWFAQRGLAQQLEQNNPSFVEARAALQTEALVPLKPAATQTSTSAPANGSAPTGSSGPATAPPSAESQRLAELAAFQAAAVKFASVVRWKTGEPLGRIVIPSIGLDVVMIEGTGKGDLREGPGHWPETPFPGQGGNFVVSGHRTTYGAPFLKINKIKVGDEIDLVLPYGVARYAVSRVVIVNPRDVQAVGQLGREQVSLAACHPIYSAKQRIVVQGDLVAFKLVQQ